MNRNLYYNIALSVLTAFCIYLSKRQFKPKVSLEDGIKENPTFRKFRNNYLLVYGLVMLSDWLQGPYIYALYKSYGYDLNQIAILFVAGFLSSAVFGTFAGSFSDRFGRKLGCLLFVLTYVMSCITKFFSGFNILLLGRLLGGVSTSLLFSVFEAWMVSEHNSRGFSPDLLSETFAWSTFLNGAVAILAGVMSNFTVDYFGLVSPFFMSAVFLVFSGIVVWACWTENYGSKDKSRSPTLWQAVGVVRGDYKIYAAGTIQYCFEAAMYTFVFLWSPALESAAGEGVKLPFGVMFSSFMVSMMIGSIIFKHLLSKNVSLEVIASNVFLTACLSFLVPAVTNNEILVYASFNVFELCCGIYFPTMGSIRSKVVPEETRSTVMNLFRVPLNLIVVLVLLKVDSISRSIIFLICASLLLVSHYFSEKLGETGYTKAAAEE